MCVSIVPKCAQLRQKYKKTCTIEYLYISNITQHSKEVKAVLKL